MLNNTVLVGRIVRNPELKETETGRKVANITLAVPRSYKNIEGEYKYDCLYLSFYKLDKSKKIYW